MNYAEQMQALSTLIAKDEDFLNEIRSLKSFMKAPFQFKTRQMPTEMRQIVIIGEPEKAWLLGEYLRITIAGFRPSSRNFINIVHAGINGFKPLSEHLNYVRGDHYNRAFGKILRGGDATDVFVYLLPSDEPAEKERQSFLLRNLPDCFDEKRVFLTQIKSEDEVTMEDRYTERDSASYYIHETRVGDLLGYALAERFYEEGSMERNLVYVGTSRASYHALIRSLPATLPFDGKVNFYCSEKIREEGIEKRLNVPKNKTCVSSLFEYHALEENEFVDNATMIYEPETPEEIQTYLEQSRFAPPHLRPAKIYFLLPHASSFSALDEVFSEYACVKVETIALNDVFCSEAIFQNGIDERKKKVFAYLRLMEGTLGAISLPPSRERIEKGFPISLNYFDDPHYFYSFHSHCLYAKCLESVEEKNLSKACFGLKHSLVLDALKGKKGEFDPDALYAEIAGAMHKDTLLRKFAIYEHNAWMLRTLLDDPYALRTKAEDFVPFDKLPHPEDDCLDSFSPLHDQDKRFSDCLVGLATLSALNKVSKRSGELDLEKLFSDLKSSNKPFDIVSYLHKNPLDELRLIRLLKGIVRSGTSVQIKPAKTIEIPAESILKPAKTDLFSYQHLYLKTGSKNSSIRVEKGDFVSVEGKKALVLESVIFPDLDVAVNRQLERYGGNDLAKVFGFRLTQWANALYDGRVIFLRLYYFDESGFEDTEKLSEFLRALYNFDGNPLAPENASLRLLTYLRMGFKDRFFALAKSEGSLPKLLKIFDDKGLIRNAVELTSDASFIKENGKDVTEELIHNAARLIDGGWDIDRRSRTDASGPYFRKGDEFFYLTHFEAVPNPAYESLFASFAFLPLEDLERLLTGEIRVKVDKLLEGELVSDVNGLTGVEAIRHLFSHLGEKEEEEDELFSYYPFGLLCLRAIAIRMKKAGILKEDELSVSIIPIPPLAREALHNGQGNSTGPFNFTLSGYIKNRLVNDERIKGTKIYAPDGYEAAKFRFRLLFAQLLEMKTVARYYTEEYGFDHKSTYACHFAPICFNAVSLERYFALRSLYDELEDFCSNVSESQSEYDSILLAFSVCSHQELLTLKEKGEADLAPRFGNLKRLDEDRFTTRFDRFDDLIRATDFLDSINNDRSARGCEDFDYIYNERKVIEHNGESFLLLYRTIYRNSAYFAATPLNPQSEYGLGTFLFFYADLFSKNGYTLETDKERLKLLFRELRRYTNMIKEDDDDDDESW